MSGLCANEFAPAAANSAVAVAGLPSAPAEIARVLGLLETQFAPTRGEALEAELDVPPGFWRVWPDRGMGVWVGRDPSPPPLVHVKALHSIDLAMTVRRLGRHGIWLYEGRVFADGCWSDALPLKPLYQRLVDGASAVAGSFGDRGGRSHQALLESAGRLRMQHPEHAVRWLEIACEVT